MQGSTQGSGRLQAWLLSKDRISTSVALVLFLMFFDRVLSFGRGILFARILGTTQYGIYTLALFPVPLLATLASLGTQSAFGRYLSRYEMGGGLHAFLRRTYLLTTALAVAFAAVAFVIPSVLSRLLFGDPTLTTVVMLSAASIPAYLLSRHLSTTFMGLKLFRAGRLVESGQVAVYAGVGIALILVSGSAKMGVLAFALSMFASVAVFAPLLVTYVRQVEPVPRALTEPRFYRSLLAFTIWFTVNPILAQIFQYVDRFSLQHLMSTSNQGIYSAAVNLSETISAIGLAITSVIYPHVSATWEKGDRAKALKDLDLAVRITAVILIVVGLALVVLGRWVIRLLLGMDYVEGAEALPFLVVFYIFTILVWLFGVYPPLIEKTYVAVIGFVAAMPLTVALNLTLIPRLGMVGAALATMTSYFVMWVVVVAICRGFGLPVARRTIVACLLCFVLLLPPLGAVAAVGLVLYACLGRTWIISREERAKAYAEASRMLGRARLILTRPR